MGAPAFDPRGRLLGITTEWGIRPYATKAAVLNAVLAKAPVPNRRPSSLAVTPTSQPDVADRSTDSRADEEPPTPISIWTKVELGFGFVDVIVLGAVVVAYRRRHG